MRTTRIKLTRCKQFFLAVFVGMGVAIVGGCAADSSKPVPTMTQDQVRSNADRAFEKLKQEEKNRTVGSGAASY